MRDTLLEAGPITLDKIEEYVNAEITTCNNVINGYKDRINSGDMIGGILWRTEDVLISIHLKFMLEWIPLKIRSTKTDTDTLESIRGYLRDQVERLTKELLYGTDVFNPSTSLLHNIDKVCDFKAKQDYLKMAQRILGVPEWKLM